MASTRFDHSLKLARAAYHLKQLHTQIVEWRDQHQLVYRIEGDLNKGEELVVLASGENPGHDPLALIVGDCIHNMRASLDLLAFALLRANHVAMSKSVPEKLVRRSSFPIFDDPNEFANRREILIGGIDSRAQTVVESLQPYQNSGTSDSLWLLHTLDIVNKHRLLNLVYSVVGHLGYEKPINVDFSVMDVEWTNQPVTDDTPVARITGLKSRDPQGPTHLEVRPDYYLALAEGDTIVTPNSVGVLLSTIYAYIDDEVFPRFVDYLG